MADREGFHDIQETRYTGLFAAFLFHLLGFINNL